MSFKLSNPQGGWNGFQLPSQNVPQNYGLTSMDGQIPSFSGAGGPGLTFAQDPISSLQQTGMGQTGAGGGGMMDWVSSINWLNKPDGKGGMQQGALMPALGAAQGIFNAWMGMKQYGLAKDQLREGKKQFALNYDAQAGTTRAAMSGQREANLRAQGVTGDALTSQLASYMDQYAPKGRG